MVRYFALGAVAIFFSLKAFGGAIPLPGPLTGTICLVLFSALFVLYRPGRLHHALPLPKWFKFAFLALIVAAIWVRVQAIREFPMDVLRADMLFTIESQIRDFLSGADPYTATTFSTGRSVARTYLPGLWLSYLPLHVLGLDLRYLNLAAHHCCPVRSEIERELRAARVAGYAG